MSIEHGRWRRCLAALSVRVTGSGEVEYLWPGKIVNLDRLLAPGFTLGQAFGEQHAGCFEVVSGPEADEAPAAALAAPGEATGESMVAEAGEASQGRKTRQRGV
jgi:hypothetical protein